MTPYQLVIFAMISLFQSGEGAYQYNFEMNLYNSREECLKNGEKIYFFMREYLEKRKFIRTDDNPPTYVVSLLDWRCVNKNPPKEEYSSDIPPTSFDDIYERSGR